MSQYIHSELQEGEIFLCNFFAEDEYPRKDMSHLKTLRIGNQALDIYGHKLSPICCRPVFLHKSEFDEYNRIMDNRMKQALKSIW